MQDGRTGVSKNERGGWILYVKPPRVHSSQEQAGPCGVGHVHSMPDSSPGCSAVPWLWVSSGAASLGFQRAPERSPTGELLPGRGSSSLNG